MMWIRIDRTRIRIHKIWSMWIRYRDNEITNLISTLLLKVKKKKYFHITGHEKRLFSMPQVKKVLTEYSYLALFSEKRPASAP